MRAYSRVLIAGLVLAPIAVATAQTAGAPATGLGQAWPNATDISSSPNYHVYLFQRHGVQYVQVNDLNGTVRGAVASGGEGSIMGLPIGVDATRIATPDEPLPAPASQAGETIYQDTVMKVFVAPQSDGTMQLRAVQSECKNPLECSTRNP